MSFFRFVLIECRHLLSGSVKTMIEEKMANFVYNHRFLSTNCLQSLCWHVIKPTITRYISSTDNNRYGRFNTHEKRGKRAGHMEFEIKILFPHVSPCAKFAYQKVTIKMSIKFQKYEAVWRQIKEIAYFIMKKLNVIYFILFPCGKCK